MKKNITILVLSLLVLSLSGQTKTVSKTTSSTTYVSIDKSDEKFLYTSYFDYVKTTKAKTIIVKNLGKPKEDNGDIALWKEKGAFVSLKNGKVQIEMYYEKADKSLITIIEKTADEISKDIK